MKYLCRLMEIFVLSYFINENRNNFYMKTKLYFYSQPNYLIPRTAIVREQKQFIQIAFAVHLSAAISAERYRSDSVALKSAVPHQKPYILVQFLIISFAYAKLICLKPPPSVAELIFVFLYIIMLKNKIEQSAKTKLLLNSPTDMPFGNRWSRYKEPSKNKAETYRVYVEHLFLRSDAGDARIFSKEVIHDGLGRISYSAKEGEVYIDGTADQT